MPFRFHTSLRTRYSSSCTWLHVWSITLISFCSLVLGWFFLIKSPTNQQELNQLKDLKLLQEKMSILQAGKDFFDQAISQEQYVQQELMALIKNLPPIRMQMDSLVDLLQQNNLTCRAIAPTLQEDAYAQNFVGYLIQATAYGSFQAIHKFLADLAVNQQFVTTWISVQKDKQHRLELQLCCKVLAQSEERQ